jgi:hypothetical protein
MSRARTIALSGALLALLALPAGARAEGPFAFEPGSVSAYAENSNGTTDTQAGSHPYAFNVHFALQKDEKTGRTEGGEMRDLYINLPPGMVGNPLAGPRCPRASFEGGPDCAPSTQVGIGKAIVPGLGEAYGPLYNIAPPPGMAAQFGYSSLGLTFLAGATVQSEAEEEFLSYSVNTTIPNLPLEVTEITATVWGNPADPAHTPERGNHGGAPSDAPEEAFFTLPTSCQAPPVITVRADSKLAPGIFIHESVPITDKGGNPVTLGGCEAVPFAPQVKVGPSAATAETPAGLGVALALPNHGLLDPAVTAETEPRKMVLTLPRGISANAAAAGGLGACSQQQFKAASLSDPGCPADSKLGTLIAHSPLLEEAIEGSLYLATPHANPFGTLVALYLVARAPERGVVVKQAGEVQIDPASGQITSSFDDLPPVPYSDLEVRLREGPRAPLTTPTTCDTYTSTAKLYPHSDPATATVKEIPFTISSGANGGACAKSEAQLPNSPTLTAGTTAPLAGAFSPFLFKVSRADGTQRFSSIQASPPPGLSAKLAGVPYCPEAGIAAALARSGEGEGALELLAPSCPAASQIATVIAGAGAGPSPYYVAGKAYLAGPYKGAPLSLVIITPAIAGPFDLGVVAVRAGIYVNEETAKITVKSDPLPSSLHGIPLDVRSASVRVDREGFALNPTNCEPLAVSGTETSLTGASAPLSQSFQVGGCRNLAFTPKLSLSLKGATRRDGHPAFKAVLTQPGGQANISRTSVALPPSEFVDPEHIGSPCTRPQFAAEQCPSISLLGKARAYSPLLEKPLEGNVYFRSNGGARELPDVVLDLRGQVHLVVVGFVDAIHKKGSEASRIRTTIATVPDAPVSKFVLELKGGKEHGLLVNSANICKVPNRAIVKLVGQNGKTHNSKPTIATSCKK